MLWSELLAQTLSSTPSKTANRPSSYFASLRDVSIITAVAMENGEFLDYCPILSKLLLGSCSNLLPIFLFLFFVGRNYFAQNYAKSARA